MKLFSDLSELTSSTGQAVSRTVGSVTAGVGRVGSSFVPAETSLQAAPEVGQFSSDEAHQRYKAYNTEFNLHLNKLREWNGYLSSAVFWLMAGAMGIATKGVIMAEAGAAAHLNLGALLVGVSNPAFLIVAGITVALGAIKMGISQYITKVQTEKGMDVSDFHIKREAELVGQEVAKQMDTKEGLSSDKAVDKAVSQHRVSGAVHDGTLQQRILGAGVA